MPPRFVRPATRQNSGTWPPTLSALLSPCVSNVRPGKSDGFSNILSQAKPPRKSTGTARHPGNGPWHRNNPTRNLYNANVLPESPFANEYNRCPYVYAAPDSSANAGLPVLLLHPKPKTPVRHVKTTATYGLCLRLEYRIRNDFLLLPGGHAAPACLTPIPPLRPARHNLPSQPPGGPDLKKIYTQPDAASSEAPETQRSKPDE